MSIHVSSGALAERCHQGAWDATGLLFSTCRKQLLSFTSTLDDLNVEAKSSVVQIVHDGPSYVLRYEDNAVDAADVLAWLTGRTVWTTGVPGRQLADACLVRLTEAAGVDVTAASTAIAHVLRTSSPSHCCPHAVLLEGSVCTTLCVDEGHRVGLVNIAELFLPRLAVEEELAAASAPLFPVPTDLLECGAEEEAMPMSTFMALNRWTTTTCATPAEELPFRKKKWGHILFVSHTWLKAGDPGTVADLRQAQRAVAHYVDKVLADKAAGNVSATVKNVSSADDFGVWVDYMLVPNDVKHMQRGCERCVQRRRRQIAKISAILTVATVIVIADERERHKRGWIIHEMSTNTHLNMHDGLLLPDDPSTQLAALDTSYLCRVNLMSCTANFTNGNDGRALRLYEFVRLSQLPRTWPAVNQVLLREWREAAVADERSIEARDILLKYARHFDQPCHRLKRLMAELPAQLAAYDVVGRQEGAAAAVDCAPLLAAIEEQARAMVDLGMPFTEEAARLQLQQFVAIAMGLRAELLHGAGFTAWLCASQLTAALAACKSSARLHGGSVVLYPASCWVSLGEDVPKEAAGGVPAVVLDKAARQLFVPPRGLRRARSGKAFVVPSRWESCACS